jgi:hypothetical protein
VGWLLNTFRNPILLNANPPDKRNYHCFYGHNFFRPALHYNLLMHRRLVFVLFIFLGIFSACMPQALTPTELPPTPNLNQLMQTSVSKVTRAAVLTQAALAVQLQGFAHSAD